MTRPALQIFIRVSLILSLGAVGVYVLTSTYFWLVSVWLFAAMILLILELAKYLNKTRRNFADFLVSVSQDDFSTRTPGTQVNDELDQAYLLIQEKIRSLRQENVSNYIFLQTVIEQSGVPLIGYETNTGKITVMNRAAKDLLEIQYLPGMDTLAQMYPDLYGSIKNLSVGKDELVKLNIKGTIHQLNIVGSDMILEDVPYRLVSLQDVQAVLEANELESWQKLIRVLTHEIKNSAIPISTLSDAVAQMILEDDHLRNLKTLGKPEQEDLINGLKTISRRSRSLVKFIEAYGELTYLPDPKTAVIKLEKLFTAVHNLMKNQLEQNNIEFRATDNDLTIIADETMIEQVLINIIKNAVEAVAQTEKPAIELSAGTDSGRVIIEVSDNGEGMDAQTMDQIFIPFFSTKHKGSGIGLSLSRQIMRIHKGELRVSSEVGKGTVFRLIF